MWAGNINNQMNPAHTAGNFPNNSLLYLCSLTRNGPLCATLALSDGDTVNITSTTSATPPVESSVELKMAGGFLTAYCSAPADRCENHPVGGASKGHHHFHVADTGIITKVTHTRPGLLLSKITVLLDASVHGSTLMTTVSVHPLT